MQLLVDARLNPITSWSLKMQTNVVLKSTNVNESKSSKRKSISGWRSKTGSMLPQTSTTFAKFKNKKNRKRRNSRDSKQNKPNYRQKVRND